MRVTRTENSLRTGGNSDDSVPAEMELSHVLGRVAGPLIPMSQSGRGCWEQAVLGNDLAGGPRDGEGTEGSACKRRQIKQN